LLAIGHNDHKQTQNHFISSFSFQLPVTVNPAEPYTTRISPPLFTLHFHAHASIKEMISFLNVTNACSTGL
jgi:hypothetical protein